MIFMHKCQNPANLGFIARSWQPAEEEVMFLGMVSPGCLTDYPIPPRREPPEFILYAQHQPRDQTMRFLTMFNQLELRQITAIRLKIRIIAKHCRAVELAMRVQFGDDYSHPSVELEL